MARRQLTPLTVNVLGFRPLPDWGRIVYVTPDTIAIVNIDDPASTGSWPGPWPLPDFYQGAPLIDIAIEQPGHRIVGTGRAAHSVLPRF